jgi:hypothetical protein
MGGFRPKPFGNPLNLFSSCAPLGSANYFNDLAEIAQINQWSYGKNTA